MLKHAIDTYNFLLDIAEKMKLKLTTMVGILDVLIAGASLLTVQALGGYSANEVSGGVAVEEKVGQAAPSLSEQSESPAVADKKAADQSNTKATDTSKQAGSTDSRQAPASDNGAKQSFSTKIERASQISAGTLVAYNANKDQKTYYGGDLLFDTQTLTISKADSNLSKNLVVSVPDESAAGQPVALKDDASSNLSITAAGNDTPQSGHKFAMTVSVAVNTPVGSYQLHLMTNRTAQSVDTWVYHGFITVNVTD